MLQREPEQSSYANFYSENRICYIGGAACRPFNTEAASRPDRPLPIVQRGISFLFITGVLYQLIIPVDFIPAKGTEVHFVHPGTVFKISVHHRSVSIGVY